MANSKIIIKIMPEIFDLIPGYLKNREDDIKLITDAIKKNDMPTLQKKGHDLKGSGKGYGFDKISEIGKEIEMAAKTSNPEMIEKQLAILKDYLENIEAVEDN